jgi:moderate conductance mechanosensitive channel
VGDVIVVGDVAGFVETMNLRITQLRNDEGRLITIPNSQITIVQNLSKEWSRVDLRIPVAPSADINQALKVIEQVAQDMQQDTTWRNLILEPPLLLGIDNLDYIGATVRIWIKTKPLKQWEVAREYRKRLKVAFDKAGISIGVPQQSLHVHNALPIVTVSHTPAEQQKNSSDSIADRAAP